MVGFEVVGDVITKYNFNDNSLGKIDKNNPILVWNAETFLNAIFETGSTEIPDQFSTALNMIPDESYVDYSYENSQKINT